jgi:dihydropteroate synthase
MQGHHAVLITNQQEARAFLSEIGADPLGLEYMIPKAVFRCIKLKGISCKAANLLKQEMLSKGGEAAVARDALNGEGVTDVLLMGNLKHYRLLTKKLRLQPFGLKELAGEIEFILKALEPHLTTIPLPNNREMELGSRTMIMGILNITPDSFSDGGRYFNVDLAVRHAMEMMEEGADIIDVGGASSRPNSIMASADEEIRRILPVIERLQREGIVISVDTFRAEVARAALEAGAGIINDIGNLQLDPGLVSVLSEYGAPVILMDNRMQLRAGEPYQDLIADIVEELRQSINMAAKAGLEENQIIIDPGIV